VQHGALVATPFGWVAAAARRGALIAVSFPADTAEQAAAWLRSAVAPGAEAPPPVFRSDVRRYLAGEPVDLCHHPVDLSGLPPFARQALLAARQVPYGQVRTYAWVAEQAGSAAAARAAGQAMRSNPVPLVVPCHRIVGATGRLTGFGGGLDLKRRLLQLEGVTVVGDRVRAAVDAADRD